MTQKAIGSVGRSISIDTFARVVRVLYRNSDAAEPRSVRQLAHSAQVSINPLNAIKQGRHYLWEKYATLTGAGWMPERFLTFKSSRIRDCWSKG